MSYYANSRYLGQTFGQTRDHTGATHLVPSQRATTMFPEDMPFGSFTKLAPAGEPSMAAMSNQYLGSPSLWWVVADANPDIFYPLDLQATDVVKIPPMSTIHRFKVER